MKPTQTLLVMAGGTGGHIFPALAIAELLKNRGWRVVWMGNPSGMEAKLVPAHGYEMAWVKFGALRGKGLLKKLSLPFALLGACWQAWREIARVKPDVVLGMGGYISFPGGMMAALQGCPLVVHEQNSVAGLANRVLAKWATRVICGFPHALPNSVWLGNPVRAEIAALAPPAERLKQRVDQNAGAEAQTGQAPLRLLVLGGSLGAAPINAIVPQGLALITAKNRPQVIHQAGAKHLETLQKNYAEAGVSAQCVAFIDDMAAAYAWADVVLCRAGALTIAELAAAGVASILVPFPQAVDDHQTSNAQFLVACGAAILWPQHTMSAESLSVFNGNNREQWLAMAEKARAQAKPDAAEAAAQICAELIKT